eukprot:gene7792-5605_t
MSTYEDATRELARIRRQFKLTPEKSPSTSRFGKSSLDDSFLSSDMPNRGLDQHLFSSSMSGIPSQPPRRTTASPTTNLRHTSSSQQFGDSSFFTSSRKTSFNLPSDNLGNSFRSSRTNGPSSSVIEAFRELQSEVKVLEAERFEALREKEELRNRILDAKRNLSLQRHRHELDATEKELQVKAHNDRLQRECEEVRMTLIAKEEIYDSMQRKLQAQQHLHQSLQEDLHRCEQKWITMEKTSTLLRRELKDITSRASNVEHVMIASPEVHRSKTGRMEETIDTLHRQIDKVNVGKMKAQSRLAALRSYVEMILKINGELCETLLARESAKREVMRLTRALTPPRYTWPKEVPYHDILHAVNETAKWTAEAAVERAALKATETALTDQYQQSLHDLLAADRANTKKRAKKTKKLVKNAATKTKRKTARRGKGSSSTGSVTSSDAGGGPEATTTNALNRFLSDVRRKKSLQTVIARQAAITHATRLAAAASAATNAVKVTAAMPPSTATATDPVTSLHRNTTASLYNRKTPHGAAASSSSSTMATNKVAFVPSSTTGSNEFNIVASVSRASRATKELNASVASRVKSLHGGGAGELFEQVPRVTLADLQHQLRAVKVLRKSFEG